MAKNKNVFRDAAISAALQNVQREMYHLYRRRTVEHIKQNWKGPIQDDTTTPENVVAYIGNVQLPRLQQVLETLLALKEEE